MRLPAEKISLLFQTLQTPGSGHPPAKSRFSRAGLQKELLAGETREIRAVAPLLVKGNFIFDVFVPHQLGVRGAAQLPPH